MWIKQKVKNRAGEYELRPVWVDSSPVPTTLTPVPTTLTPVPTTLTPVPTTPNKRGRGRN